MSARVGFVSDPLFHAHDPGATHPERPARLDAIERALAEAGLAQELELLAPAPIERAMIERVHAPAYVERVAATAGRAASSLDPDTHVSARSFEVALAASGGLLAAAERVLDGRWSSAFVAARPPGHHAERDRAMGFCLFDHVAVVARALQERHGLSRVAIVDWDVHHGNGTQHIFEDDASVFYASLHQSPLYPGTGAASERGIGAGEGATLNCPLPARAGNSEWLTAFEGQVLPALESFAPEFVLISAGFDAHALDPLADTCLDEAAYRQMTLGLLEACARVGHGRVASLLEGGYSLEALGRSVVEHVGALVEAGR